ncbi:MAG: VOC family protein [Geminicoccaceae bacterium]|nr:VOC family protein [Geminicoccaceae bacterium]
MVDPLIEDAVAIVPVEDVARSVDFYVRTLGFEQRMLSDDRTFATVVHGEAAIHFIGPADEAALQATRSNIAIYLWVKGVDALYDRLQAKLEPLPEGRVRAPFDQPYGMREFHVKDPDGCLLFFGEPL